MASVIACFVVLIGAALLVQLMGGAGPGLDSTFAVNAPIAIPNVHVHVDVPSAIPNTHQVQIQGVVGPAMAANHCVAGPADDDVEDSSSGSEIGEDDTDNDEAGPSETKMENEDEINCRWKSVGFVLCLLRLGNKKKLKKFHKKSEILRHYHSRHKGNSSYKDFVCTKCGQPVKDGHNCTVPNGYQFN